jgi:hypothetical protein
LNGARSVNAAQENEMGGVLRSAPIKEMGDQDKLRAAGQSVELMFDAEKYENSKNQPIKRRNSTSGTPQQSPAVRSMPSRSRTVKGSHQRNL